MTEASSPDMNGNGVDHDVMADAAASFGIEGAGDLPLSDPSAEKQLLGALLRDNGAMAEIRDVISEHDFSITAHRRIFAECLKAFDEGYALGPKSLTEGLGGDPKAAIFADGTTVSQYIASLIAEHDATLKPDELADVIFECAERRAMELQDDLDPAQPFQSRMGLRMWIDQNDPGPEYEYLIEDLIPEQQGILLIGETQTGKSFLTYYMAMCGARGVPFFGRRILKPFGVVWCAYEAAAGAPARMRAYRRYHNLELEDLPFAALQRPLKLWPEEGGVDAIIAEIKGIERTKFNGVRLGMVVIDTHNAGTPGASEIDSEVVSKIRDRYHKIISATGASLVIVGHTNSQGKHRGNEQLGNNIDTIIKVFWKTKTQGRDVFQLKDDDGREMRTMKVQKQREGQSGDEHDFILRVVEDGTKNRFGKARTSCVVAPPNVADTGSDDVPRQNSGERHVGAKLTKQEILFIECVLSAADAAGVAPPAELGLPRSIPRVVEYDIVKKLMHDKMLREDDNTDEGNQRHRERVRKALTRARIGMMHIKVVGCHSPYIWWTGKAVQGIAQTQPKRPDMFNAPDADDGDLGEFA